MKRFPSLGWKILILKNFLAADNNTIASSNSKTESKVVIVTGTCFRHNQEHGSVTFYSYFDSKSNLRYWSIQWLSHGDYWGDLAFFRLILSFASFYLHPTNLPFIVTFKMVSNIARLFTKLMKFRDRVESPDIFNQHFEIHATKKVLRSFYEMLEVQSWTTTPKI